MALTTEELAIIDTSKNNTQTTLNLMNQVFTYTSNYKDINANSDSDVSISYIDSNGVEQSYTVPTFYKMNTTFQNLMTTMSDGNNYYTKTEVDTKDSAIEAIAKRSGFKNYIINGGFDIWQRGTTFTILNGGYSADRWASGIGAGTITREKFIVGTEAITGLNAKYYLQWNIAENSINHELLQRIESVRTLAGKKITISFWAKSDTGTEEFGWAVYQNFGTGGTPTTLRGSGGVYTPSTSWQRFSFTVDIPDLTGTTIGTNGDDFLWIRVAQLTTNNATTLHIAGVQVELGEIATEFEHRPYGLELSLCQRYYETLTAEGGDNSQALSGTYRPANSTIIAIWTYKVQKRTIPTLSATAGSTGIMDGFNPYSGIPSMSGLNTQSCIISVPVTNYDPLTGFSTYITINSTGSIVADAEL